MKLSLLLLKGFDPANTGFQFVEDRPWIMGLHYKMGVDGISILFVMLTTFLMPITIASCWNVETRVKDYMIAFLLLQAFGITLNQMVMFGLILAVGILVDGGIVIVEYADRKQAEGMAKAEAFAAAAGSPFGSLRVDTAKCTMCLSCVGACPEGALADNPDRPQLRFIEKNCVQCGLCATTCPEQAITLQPRLSLVPERTQARVLHNSPPYGCIRCGKPFGTVKAIETMLQFITTSGSLSDWGKLQARVLFEEVHSWQHLEVVPLETWQAKFHLSKVKATSRSAQAFKDYLRINEFEELVP